MVTPPPSGTGWASDYSRWSWRGLTGPFITVLCGAAPAGLVVIFLGARSALSLALLGVIGVLTLSALYASLRLCGWFPTQARDFERIRALAELGPGRVFVDLGCGDGRVAAYLARTSGARCIGVELSLFHFALARLRKTLSGASTLELRLGDLYSQDLSGVDVVYLYGIPPALKEARLEKLLATLPAGARVISYHFALPGRTPDVVDDPGEGRLPLYVYRMRR